MTSERSASEGLKPADRDRAAGADLSRGRFEMALRAAGMGTWRWDIPANAVDWDDPMQELFGFPAGTFPGTYDAYAGRLHPADRALHEQRIAAMLADRSELLVSEHRVLLPDVTVRWLSSTARLSLGPDGEPLELIGVAVDVTARHDAAEARQAEARAVEAERVARQEADSSHRRLALLARLSQLLAAPLDVVLTLRQAAELAVDDFADWCAVDLAEDGRVDRLAVAHRASLERDPAQQTSALFSASTSNAQTTAMLSDLIPFFADVVNVDEPSFRMPLSDQHGNARIVAPLVARGVGIGWLTLARTDGRRFTAQDLELAAELGRRVGSAAEKARLYEERDHAARLLQLTLRPPDPPRIPGVDIGHYYRPWTAGLDVGGDYYDFFRLGDHWWITLGDVCGKGPAAAAVGTSVRYAVRALALHLDDPAVVLARLNAVLQSAEGGVAYTTLLLLRLASDRERVHLRIATGGHPPPLVRRRSGRVDGLSVRGSLLGLLQEVHIGQADLTLEPGDALLLYTDGVTDSLNSSPAPAEDVLAAMLASAPAVNAQAMVDTLAGGWRQLAANIRDDAAVLAVLNPIRPPTGLAAQSR